MNERKEEDLQMSFTDYLVAGVIIALMIVGIFFALLFIGRLGEPQDSRDRAIEACGNSRFSYEVSCPEPEDEYGY